MLPLLGYVQPNATVQEMRSSPRREAPATYPNHTFHADRSELDGTLALQKRGDRSKDYDSRRESAVERS